METQALSVFEGFYHGLVFSIPFSVPILICISRFLLEGFFPGLFASLGTVLGQFVFFFFIVNGTGASRSLIHVWYTFEPFLAFIGFIFAFKLASDFMSGTRTNRSNSNTLAEKSLTPFLASFVLMFLNPPMGSTSSRILLTTGSFFENSSFLTIPYILVFGVTFLGFVLFLWPLIITLFVTKGGPTEKLLRFVNIPAESFGPGRAFQPVPEARILISFLLVGCLMSGGFQYSWRLFTQYPASFVDREGQSAWVREFPSFDSNIQHRDKNLPLDRHLPVDKMNSRRVLSGRPPLSEQQKADASLKFQSFFLNTLEEKIENQLLKYRSVSNTSSFSSGNKADITDFLLSLKSQGRSLGFFVSPDNSTRFVARPLENNTKGKPKFSYIQSDTLNQGKELGIRDILHDELQVYGALFAKS
uniref:Hypothetical chloroplast RF1 n=1 Tax=Monomastix sp. (strain OKE-1) TaxID=141716 RepID=C0JWL8_MONSK|nr:hypothetical chloroplast RF1 [Monomastix sp. OKE-1]ACK36880.1 hypothetical chloroplast RF1 [Monomastix sp. OKE-1]